MVSQNYKRKLAAILIADVKGYSRLMGEDDEATIGRLMECRELFFSLIQQHYGRVVDSPGDNILAEFASVVDAVQCALKIQGELKLKNDDLPANHRMEFRIGVNLGDVVAEGDQIYGDGVNIAARLENLADGGGVCISGSVYKQVKNKLNLGYEYLGERSVKNIVEPINVYRVLMEPEAAGKVIDDRRAGTKGWKKAVVAAGALVVVAAAVGIWYYYFRSSDSLERIASVVKPAVPLADRASIAVLPFKNLSGDTEQEYFSDGITNDIITDLSKFRELLVIASNTVFTYKGRTVKVRQVSDELGVRYVLEGSVQKLSNKVRINAQLIDATTDHHIWADRFDRDLVDLFAVQNEIVRTIVTTLAIKVEKAERERAMRKDTHNLEAYDYVLRGHEYYNQRTRSANVKAKEMFNKAIELDPAYADAYVALAKSYVNDVAFGWTEFPDKASQKAMDLVNKAIVLDESNAAAHALIGATYVFQQEYDLALGELHQAIALNPNDASSYHILGWVALFSSRTAEAIDALETNMRFDPNTSPTTFYMLGSAYFLKGQYDKAIRALKKGVIRKSDFVDLHIILAAAYAQAGQQEDAIREAQTVLKLRPFFEVDDYGTAYRDPADREKILEGLRKAGMK